MSEPLPGYMVTVKDLADDIKALTVEIHRQSGQLAAIDNAVNANSAALSDYGPRIRSLEDTRISAEALAAYKRRATAAMWAAVTAVTAAAVALGGFLMHVHLH